jgi:hypothetical protein
MRICEYHLSFSIPWKNIVKLRQFALRSIKFLCEFENKCVFQLVIFIKFALRIFTFIVCYRALVLLYPTAGLLTFHFLIPIISTTGCGQEVCYHFLSPHPLITSTLLKLT